MTNDNQSLGTQLAQDLSIFVSDGLARGHRTTVRQGIVEMAHSLKARLGSDFSFDDFMKEIDRQLIECDIPTIRFWSN